MILFQEEKEAIQQFRRGSDSLDWDHDKRFPWTQFGLFETLKICQIVRTAQYHNHGETTQLKSDNSPTLPLEKSIEDQLSDRLKELPENASLIGEESGGELKGAGIEVVIDPIDGTRAFLTGSDRYSTVISFFRDGYPFLSFVGNPSTGEVFYATAGTAPRILALSVSGNDDSGYTLPLEGIQPDTLLIDVHPNRKSADLFQKLFKGWNDNKIRLLRSSGGSPSLALAESTKGHFIYINLWADAPTSPFDLAPATHILHASGGLVLDMAGKMVKPLEHQGAFIAGHDETKLRKVLTLLSENI